MALLDGKLIPDPAELKALTARLDAFARHLHQAPAMAKDKVRRLTFWTMRWGAASRSQTASFRRATDDKEQLMARWKKPTKEEVLQNRRTLAERARAGDLRLPGAVAEIRKGIGMTQEEFAKALGLSRRQIAELEAGTANPTLETLKKIGRAFGFGVGFTPRGG